MNKNLFLIAFLEGALVMIIELVGAKLIAPYFGSSIVTWTCILCTVVLALAIGYFLGAMLSKANQLDRVLLKILNLSFVVISFIPIIAHYLGGVMNEKSAYMGIITMSLSLLLIPNVLLGTISPILIELLNRRNKTNTAGKNSGRIFSISTFGGIVATLSYGFFIIPEFGLALPLILFCLVAWLIVVFGIFGKEHYQLLSFIPIIFIGAGIFMGTAIINNKNLYHSEGLLGQVTVADITNKWSRKEDRILFVNRMGQTWVNKKTGKSEWHYPEYMKSLASTYPTNSRVLLMGLGGGTIAKALETELNLNLDVVELDVRIKEVAKDYFGYNSSKTKIDDARHYLRRTNKKYDLIIFDVFKGEVAPSYLLTFESFNQAKSNLKSGGSIMINFNGFISGKNGLPLRSVHYTLIKAGYNVRTIFTGGKEKNRNAILMASLGKLNYDNPRHPIFIGGQMRSTSELFSSNEIPKGKALLLSDDKPNLEILNIPASQSWRKDYKETFISHF